MVAENSLLAVMKTIHRILLVPTFAAISGLLIPSTSYSAVKPTEEEGPVLPEIWQKAGPRERLKATRAAELDADRLLAERIYGLEVDSETTIADLAAGDDKIDSAVSATLVGSLTTEPPEYLADGTVQVVRAVKIREVINTLNTAIKGKVLKDGSVQALSNKTKTNTEVKDSVIDVMGNAALPGSEGHQKVMAKRAAELDAYRRLAARMLGIQIDSNTTVRDMALENDELVAGLSHVLKGAATTGIKFNKDDGSCEVTMAIKTADVLRTTKRIVKGEKVTTTIKDSIEEKTFSETGRGAMREVAQGDAPAAAATESAPVNQPTIEAEVKISGRDPFFETTAIIKEVVQSGPVVQ
jgi:hypothetical protein